MPMTRSAAASAVASLFLAGAAGAQSLPGPLAAPLPAPERDVAAIVSPEWSDEASRDAVGEARDVMRLAGIGPGSSVADIGAGSGYYVMRVSPVVGARGRVIAQDVEPRYLARLKQRVTRARLGNVSFVQGSADDARLPPASIDVALMVHMYHEIAQPYRLLDNLRASFRPGGRLVIVDLDRQTAWHGTPKALLACELKAVGYQLVAITDIRQGYSAVFRPGPRPDPASVRACRA